MWKRALIYGAVLTTPSLVYCFESRGTDFVATIFTFVGLVVGMIAVPVHALHFVWLRPATIIAVNFAFWTGLVFGLMKLAAPKREHTDSVVR